MAGSVPQREFSVIEELSGKLESDSEEKRLMRTILEDDKQAIDDAHLILEAINHGIGAFTPDMIFEQLVTSYQLAKRMMGEALIRALTGYEPDSVERNLDIPEFRRELKERLRKRTKELKSERLLDNEDRLTEKAAKLAALVMYAEELEKLTSKGYGETQKKRLAEYGQKEGTKPYAGERYRDIAIRKSIRKTIRRSHRSMQKRDLESFERESKGENTIVYALDASGSMKGKKLEQCKNAGIALAFKAIQEGDSVGVMVFGKQVRTEVPPTQNFYQLLKKVVGIKALEQTDIASTVRKAVELFEAGTQDTSRHIIVITDIMPTAGEEPERDTLDAVAEAAAKNITVSVIGVEPDRESKRLAERMAEVGKGRFILVKNLEDIDVLVLEDYYAATANV